MWVCEGKESNERGGEAKWSNQERKLSVINKNVVQEVLREKRYRKSVLRGWVASSSGRGCHHIGLFTIEITCANEEKVVRNGSQGKSTTERRGKSDRGDKKKDGPSSISHQRRRRTLNANYGTPTTGSKQGKRSDSRGETFQGMTVTGPTDKIGKGID